MPPLQTPDFWRVAGYGYPNPFRPKAKKAWTAFRTFCEYDGGSYKALKAFWDTTAAPRELVGSALESWKQAFEEFGLLYVITRSDRITITPGGLQFIEAAGRKDESDLAWIGLNLVLRYPLQGPPPPRRPKSPAHRQSNLLLYRFLYSAMRDLGDYFWWTEFERIFCRVFDTSEARSAVDAVRALRVSPHSYADYPLPTINEEDAFYNSLNQVCIHAGLNHLIIVNNKGSKLYGAAESQRRHSITHHHISLVSAALADFSVAAGCGADTAYVDRLPTAPSFTDEQAYFDYLGAPVPSFAATAALAGPQSVNLAGDAVFVLRANDHFQEIATSGLERTIEGNSSALCRIALNHRVILSINLEWTYLVLAKNLVGSNTVRLTLRRARPITNADPIRELLEGDNA